MTRAGACSSIVRRCWPVCRCCTELPAAKPHLLTVMIYCACISQADCRPCSWCHPAHFIPILRPADIGYDPVTGKTVLFFGREAWYTLNSSTYMHMHEVISSPMLLYRLRCLFPSCEVQQWDGYKGVWRVSLRHKRTHCNAEFGEHKGAVVVCGDTSMEKDRAATQDLLDLIHLVCSDRCPHPYEGTVAGCVA